MLCQYNYNEMDGSAYKMLIQFSLSPTTTATAALNKLMRIYNYYYYSVCSETNLWWKWATSAQNKDIKIPNKPIHGIWIKCEDFYFFFLFPQISKSFNIKLYLSQKIILRLGEKKSSFPSRNSKQRKFRELSCILFLFYRLKFAIRNRP